MTARIGLDIGATKVLGVAALPDGDVLASVRRRTVRGAGGVVASAAEVVEELVAAHGRPGAVGVGVPGLVDPGAGTVAHAVNLGLGDDPLALGTLLGDRLGVPVVLENDVNVAAVGATALVPSARGGGPPDLAYLSLGTGLAAGLVLGGVLRRGASGAAGEIGHVPVDPAGPRCACGQRGCLETVASGAAIAAAWPVPDGRPAAHALLAAAAAGDVRAQDVVATVAGHVAAAVRLLVLTLDVDVVVLGGGVAEAGAPVRDAVADALRRQARTSPFLTSLDLPARLLVVPAGYPVAAVGAALLPGVAGPVVGVA